jgi:hypothetical protein
MRAEDLDELLAKHAPGAVFSYPDRFTFEFDDLSRLLDAVRSQEREKLGLVSSEVQSPLSTGEGKEGTVSQSQPVLPSNGQSEAGGSGGADSVEDVRRKCTQAIENANADAARGDLAYLKELADCWRYQSGQARGWFLIAKAMGYEGPGFFEPPPSCIAPFVVGQIEKSRAKIAAAIRLSSEAPTPGVAIWGQGNPATDDPTSSSPTPTMAGDA